LLIPVLTSCSTIVLMVDSLVNNNPLRIYPETHSIAVLDAPVARRRMTVADRENHIVQGAIRFFSEHGLNAQMRDLARAIGVTHTLVYHYFPTKQALLDRVYLQVFEGRWKPEWESLLDDRALSAEEKITRFYIDYARTVLTRDFVRILIFSGLTDHSITDRFFELLGERLFPRLIRETRRYRGSRSRARCTAREHELLMGLHGGVFYGGLRSFVYANALHADPCVLDDATLIADRVHGYLAASLALEPFAALAPRTAKPKKH
jgi:AcrR family transcriptional regulator